MLTTKQAVEFLDQFIIGQDEAKRAVALAYRERMLKLGQKDKAWGYIVPANVIMAGPSGVGKAQPLNSLVKIPNGWKKMRDISYGDELSMPDGTTAKVTGVYPQGFQPTAELTFVDGRKTRACLNHLWKVTITGVDAPVIKILSTYQLIEMMKSDTKYKISVELINHEKDSDKEIDLPLNPYLLGVLLGDGGLSRQGVKLTTSYPYLVDKVNTILSDEGSCLGHNDKEPNEWWIRKKQRDNKKPNCLLILEDMNLTGERSWGKFIPDVYFTASREQRLELIRGLMDTDGYVSETGSCSYTTVSLKLAKGMVSLIRSVGGIARISEKHPKYTYKGEVKAGQTAYVINIRHKNPRDLVTIQHKKERLKEVHQYSDSLRLKLLSIGNIKREICQCIMVHHPDHLYITDNFVVTHNTEIARHLAELTGAPFVKAEITEFTQVGYHGRDVTEIINDLYADAVRIAPKIWAAEQKAKREAAGETEAENKPATASDLKEITDESDKYKKYLSTTSAAVGRILASDKSFSQGKKPSVVFDPTKPETFCFLIFNRKAQFSVVQFGLIWALMKWSHITEVIKLVNDINSKPVTEPFDVINCISEWTSDNLKAMRSQIASMLLSNGRLWNRFKDSMEFKKFVNDKANKAHKALLNRLERPLAPTSHIERWITALSKEQVMSLLTLINNENLIIENKGPELQTAWLGHPGDKDFSANTNVFNTLFNALNINTGSVASALSVFTDRGRRWNDTSRGSSNPNGMPDDYPLRLVEERGIVFIDEFDKIFLDQRGSNVGNTGVVRDLMPLLDGTEVKLGQGRRAWMERDTGGGKSVNTANILFIVAGAFQMVPITALPPEILGRVPVHIRLNSLTRDNIRQILVKPFGSALANLKLLLNAEGLDVEIDDKAIDLIADLVFACNTKGEDIGARRITGVCHNLFSDMRFNASFWEGDRKIHVKESDVRLRYDAILESIPKREDEDSKLKQLIKETISKDRSGDEKKKDK